jgi:hypothetical protein
MPAQHCKRRPGCGIPKPRGAIVGCSENLLAVRRKLHSRNSVQMAPQDDESSTGFDILQPGRAVLRCGRHTAAIGRKRHAQHWPFMALQHSQRRTGLGIPQSRCSVL